MEGRTVFLIGVICLVLGAWGKSLNDSTGCPEELKGRCRCGLHALERIYPELNPGSPMFVTNCTNSRFQDPDVLSFIPTETEYLIFTGNEFRELPPNVFGEEDTNLKIVDLSDNHITHHRLFSNFYSLKYLHLTNAFTEAEDSEKYFLSLERIFAGSSLDELKILHLEQNEIHSFSNGGVFCHLPSVEEIYLGDNLIRKLSFNVSCLTKLRVLDLRRNLIEFLDEGSRKLLDEIPSKNFQVDLGLNPFLCDCHIKDTLTWMNETKVVLLERKDYRCRDGIPKSNINKTLDEIREMQCFSASPQSVNAVYPMAYEPKHPRATEHLLHLRSTAGVPAEGKNANSLKLWRRKLLFQESLTVHRFDYVCPEDLKKAECALLDARRSRPEKL
ncbi:unnamed protein product [Darwinula stevensoni]|uniref:LRRCT domain-containing protein n=1 Tax=Darwinula stevensoni TaxID=69355 RepID=A0A7R9A0Z8_9CRUS|nr:unnamed protein product [Darwinula stevensoni]CAG0882371.1 unnamed protein product [Darwinula stevensoni]